MSVLTYHLPSQTKVAEALSRAGQALLARRTPPGSERAPMGNCSVSVDVALLGADTAMAAGANVRCRPFDRVDYGGKHPCKARANTCDYDVPYADIRGRDGGDAASTATQPRVDPIVLAGGLCARGPVLPYGVPLATVQ